ncbi:MAG: ATP-binding protein [Candidatus Kapabacteria bacterium]|nr:ATP-binding protein [Ignavibacteriota bacterium]MCW5886288.1 ATP-binding protein [Candidatus Kapabacteria bacterium]
MGFKIEKGEKIKISGIVALLYGEPGAGKTSTALSSSKPILFDFDGGVQRCEFRTGKDIVRISKWTEITSSFAKFDEMLADYDTIVIDTVDNCLKYIRIYIEDSDYKMKTNKLQMYGRMKDEFELFLNRIKNMNKNVVLIAHSTTEEQNGVQRTIPKITGGSRDIVASTSDYIGYMRMINNQRTVNFNPTDLNEGKVTGKFGIIKLPDFREESEHGSNFFAGIFEQMRKAMQLSADNQAQAVQDIKIFADRILKSNNADSLHELMNEMSQIKNGVKKQLWERMKVRAGELNLEFDPEKKKFFKPAPVAAVELLEPVSSSDDDFNFE